MKAYSLAGAAPEVYVNRSYAVRTFRLAKMHSCARRASNAMCLIPSYGWTDVLACNVRYSYVFTAAKLIAPVMDKKDWEAGYDWVVETIKLDHEYLASKMEIEKALHYLKTKEFDKVFGTFLGCCRS